MTDLIPGDSLETLLNRKRDPGECSRYENDNCALNDRELANIALQIASGMQHLETKKVRVDHYFNCAVGLCKGVAKQYLLLHNCSFKGGHFFVKIASISIKKSSFSLGFFANTIHWKITHFCHTPFHYLFLFFYFVVCLFACYGYENYTNIPQYNDPSIKPNITLNQRSYLILSR